MTAIRSVTAPLTRESVVYLLPAAAAVTLFAVGAAQDGGYPPEHWLPATLVALGLFLATLAAPAARRQLAAAPLAPLLLGLFALWNAASMLWAKVPADAWTGTNRTILYALVFGLFSALPVGRQARFLLVGGWAFAIAAIGVVDVLRAAGADSPTHFFIVGRLAVPVAYSNANAALFGMAFLPLQVLASRRDVVPWLRVLAVTAATALLELLVLCQSRGSIVALALVVVLYLVLTGSFLRALPMLAVSGVFAAASLPWLLDVYTTVTEGGDYTATLSRARLVLIVSLAAAAAAGAAVALVDRRWAPSPELTRRLRRGVLAATAVAALAAIVAVALFGHPVSRARTAWHDFKTNERAPVQTIHLASGVGTSRYDVYRIALHEFRSHPLLGDGSDNYLVPYLQQRRTGETARYPESVELRVLSETGAVGAVLFFAFLVLAVRNALGGIRKDVSGAALAAFLVFAFWFVHGSVDWLWEFPGLAAPALAFLALAGAPANGVEAAAAGDKGARRRSVTAAVAGVAAVGAAAIAVSVVMPWFALRTTNEAIASGTSSPGVYALLHRAADWNPLSEDPALAEASIAASAGDRARERRALNDALERNPHDWYTYLMLGIVDGREHRLAAAQADLARARALSPHDEVVIYAQRRLTWGTPLTEREVAQIFAERNRTQTGTAQA